MFQNQSTDQGRTKILFQGKTPKTARMAEMWVFNKYIIINYKSTTPKYNQSNSARNRNVPYITFLYYLLLNS